MGTGQLADELDHCRCSVPRPGPIDVGKSPGSQLIAESPFLLQINCCRYTWFVQIVLLAYRPLFFIWKSHALGNGYGFPNISDVAPFASRSPVPAAGSL